MAKKRVLKKRRGQWKTVLRLPDPDQARSAISGLPSKSTGSIATEKSPLPSGQILPSGQSEFDADGGDDDINRHRQIYSDDHGYDFRSLSKDRHSSDNGHAVTSCCFEQRKWQYSPWCSIR